MNKHKWAAASVATMMTGCQLNDGVLCSYLNDNCGDEAGAEEGSGTGDDGQPPAPLQPACEQIGAAVGQSLGPNASEPYGITTGDAVAVIRWLAAMFPPRWSWGDLPFGGAIAAMSAIADTFNPAIRALSIAQYTDGAPWVWVQTRGASTAEFGDQVATGIVQADGTTLYYAPASGLASGWWETQSIGVDHWVSGRVGGSAGAAHAGPAGGNAQDAIESGVGFIPAMGTCFVIDATDDTGGGTGGSTGDEPDPQVPPPIPGSFDPCPMLGEGAGVAHLTEQFPLPWLNTGLPAGTLAFGAGAWAWETPAPAWGDPAALSVTVDYGITIPGDGFSKTRAGVQFASYEWVPGISIAYYPEGMDSIDDVMDAAILEFEDGSVIAYVESPPAGGGTWVQVDADAGARGWVLDADDTPGVQTGHVGTAWTSSAGLSFLPAAGWCVD